MYIFFIDVMKDNIFHIYTNTQKILQHTQP